MTIPEPFLFPFAIAIGPMVLLSLTVMKWLANYAWNRFQFRKRMKALPQTPAMTEQAVGLPDGVFGFELNSRLARNILERIRNTGKTTKSLFDAAKRAQICIETAKECAGEFTATLNQLTSTTANVPAFEVHQRWQPAYLQLWPTERRPSVLDSETIPLTDWNSIFAEWRLVSLLTARLQAVVRVLITGRERAFGDEALYLEVCQNCFEVALAAFEQDEPEQSKRAIRLGWLIAEAALQATKVFLNDYECSYELPAYQWERPRINALDATSSDILSQTAIEHAKLRRVRKSEFRCRTALTIAKKASEQWRKALFLLVDWSSNLQSLETVMAELKLAKLYCEFALKAQALFENETCYLAAGGSSSWRTRLTSFPLDELDIQVVKLEALIEHCGAGFQKGEELLAKVQLHSAKVAEQPFTKPIDYLNETTIYVEKAFSLCELHLSETSPALEEKASAEAYAWASIG